MVTPGLMIRALLVLDSLAATAGNATPFCQTQERTLLAPGPHGRRPPPRGSGTPLPAPPSMKPMGSWTPSAPLGMPQRGEQLSISPPQAMVTSSSSSASSIPHEPNWESRLQRSCCNPPAAAGFGAGAAQVRHALVGSNWPFPLRGLIVDLMSAERSVTALRFRASRRHRIELDVGPSRFRGLVQSVGALRSVGAFGRSDRACHLIACQDDLTAASFRCAAVATVTPPPVLLPLHGLLLPPALPPT